MVLVGLSKGNKAAAFICLETKAHFLYITLYFNFNRPVFDQFSLKTIIAKAHPIHVALN